MQLPTILDDAARLHGDRTALVISRGGAAATFHAVHRRVRQAAAALRRQGYGAGERIALLLPNGEAFPIVYFAVLRLGAIVVPINPLLKAMEIRHIVSDAECAALVSSPAKLPEAAAGCREVPGLRQLFLYGEEEPPGVNLLALADAETPDAAPAPGTEDDTAVIMYTSGTTGRPKGAMLSHRNLLSNARSGAALFGFGADDRVLTALPLTHIYGQTCTLNAPWLAGACVVLHDRFDAAEVLESIQRRRVTAFLGVPTMFWHLRNALTSGPQAGAVDLRSIRLLNSGGATLPVEVLHAVNALFGVSMLEGYGLSETSPIVLSNTVTGVKKPGSVGVPIPAVEARVVNDRDEPLPPREVGEIVVRGPNVMQGYFRNPAATAEVMRGGWFHSGDLAYVDEDGYFFIVGRKKEIINRGGYNVYPREVEEVLYSHAKVREAAVVGVPHVARGEEVKAFVALHDGCSATAEEIIAYCRERIASYKCPSIVEFLDALPKGTTGKILKRALTDHAD
ncbi:MAG: long-chain fatty acid--CoA ligase [Candidatus Tectomicrobia bacterium]|nr:long-chain fatty acid--CoA ligase [Candidatus Tectomicrobia bacterium]